MPYLDGFKEYKETAHFAGVPCFETSPHTLQTSLGRNGLGTVDSIVHIALRLADWGQAPLEDKAVGNRRPISTAGTGLEGVLLDGML